MLQEAVDALIDNGRRGRPVTGPGNRALKSLSDMLKGKSGRFRQNLLGKRVDYSGRSVIVVGPELKIYQCGLPKEMAIELFKPFVMKELVANGTSHNIKNAKKMVEKLEPAVWDVLEDVIKEHPVMLNRAPTLHRLGIQAFEPILVEGKAIKLHPLVCTAFNADFDGDQMAVHLPLSQEAQAECRFLLLSPNNLLKPSDGGPVAVPSQDMVLGIYYLTQERPGNKGEGKFFKSVNEAILAYENKVITLQTKIIVHCHKTMPDGTVLSGNVHSTLGRFLFNEILPQDLGFVDRSVPGNELLLEVDFLVGKKQLKQILEKVINTHGATKTAEVLDSVKAMGYKYSTRAAMTVSISDMTVPPQKPEMIKQAQDTVDRITKNYKRGLITEEERYKEVVETWKATDDKLTEALLANWSDAYNKRHEHGNKTVIDKITQTLLDNWNAAYTHIGNKSNPHGVTKAQVGLGSVPNVATNDQTPTFTQASALGNLSSGEKLTISLGKIMKAIADFIAHKEDAVLHITTAERTNWNDANSKKHAHSNKSVIDGITQVLVDKWNSALTALPAHTHTKSQITDMPTKVSQFTNDAGYITQADVDASQSHTHSNKTVLDKITQSLLDTWNGKAGTSVATQAANGLMSAADKKKLDGVAAGANNYVHPSAHPASMITQDATHRFTSDTEKNGWNKFLFSAAITVPASGWSAEVPYTQTVSVSGLTSAMDVMLTLNITGSPTTDQVKVWKAALGMIDVGTTADGSVSFTCYSKKPAVDLPLYIKSV